MHELKEKLRHGSGDVYSHLNEVLNRIVKYHPYDAYERFEEISNLVKQTNF